METIYSVIQVASLFKEHVFKQINRFESDQSELQLKLSSIDSLLQTVRDESRQQSIELDELLELYERSVSVQCCMCGLTISPF